MPTPLKPCILHSPSDLASANIFSHLRKANPAIPCIELPTLTDPDAAFLEAQPFDYFIAVSRHRSASNNKSFTAHTPGNWAANEHGGEPRKLSFCYPGMLALVLRELDARRPEGWAVSLEADHHGPSLGKPILFAELGSTEAEWADQSAGKLVAEAVSGALGKINAPKTPEQKVAFCVGGTHYAAAFTKRVLSGELAPAHILPKHHAETFDFWMFTQAMEKTCEKVDVVAIDWKGLRSADREKIIGFCRDYGIEFEKI